MEKKASFKSKLKALFTGGETFPKRLLPAFLAALALCFEFFFFGPLDLAYLSRSYVSWSALDILPVSFVLMLILTVLLTLAAAVPGGRIHEFLVSACLGTALAAYIQGAFLNPDLGTLDGRVINWPGFSTKMMINLAVWSMILLLPHLIRVFSSRLWRTFAVTVSAALILMQAVPLTVKLADQANTDSEKPKNYYLSTENMLKLGREKNLTVFLLDTVSNRDIEETTEAFPDILNQFADFTRFDNANSNFMMTFPSLVEILTAYDPKFTAFDYAEILDEAWKNPAAEAFYSGLQEEGYEINFYLLANEVTNSLADIRHLISNVKERDRSYEIDRGSWLKLIKLSLYRYLPIAAKPFFVIYTADINSMIRTPDAIGDQWDFVKAFRDAKLEPGSKDKVWNFFYLQGTHLPYILNEKGHIQGDYSQRIFTGKTDQTAGFLNLIGLYLWQMKFHGVYDDSLIVIMADHGNNVDVSYDPQPIFWIKPPGQADPETKISHAPITTQTHFLPTAAKLLGLENYDYGSTVFDIPENKVIDRFTRKYCLTDEYPTLPGKNYNAVTEYHYTGDRKEIIRILEKDEKSLYPIYNSFY